MSTADQPRSTLIQTSYCHTVSLGNRFPHYKNQSWIQISLQGSPYSYSTAPSKALKAFCSNKCSALQSYGLATITPWGAIYSGALDWLWPNPKRVSLIPLQIKNQLFSAAQRKRRHCSLPLATLSRHTCSGEIRAGHRSD